MWAPEHWDGVKAGRIASLTILTWETLLFLKEEFIFMDPLWSCICQTMIQESSWELCDITFNRRLRWYLLRKMPLLNGTESSFNVGSVLIPFLQSVLWLSGFLSWCWSQKDYLSEKELKPELYLHYFLMKSRGFSMQAWEWAVSSVWHPAAIFLP